MRTMRVYVFVREYMCVYMFIYVYVREYVCIMHCALHVYIYVWEGGGVG